MKKLLKIILIVLLVAVVAVAGLFLWLTIAEYKPLPVEDAEYMCAGDNDFVRTGEALRVVSWNIGYAGLGADSDFFMDGGKNVMAADKATVAKYLDGIEATLKRLDPDIAMLQEVDKDSRHSYGTDEVYRLWMTGYSFAPNYVCPFVPFPLPPIGRVNSGVMTTTDDVYIESAQRIALPCPFSWPIRVANLKRCLLVSYLPIEGSDKKLVMVNLHLEAYDNGEGKIAQTRQLIDFITGEYEQGNYVIAGGDFNQAFPGSLEAYPTDPKLWEPGILDVGEIPEGWTLGYDLSSPSCRSLDRPYDASDEGFIRYVIDGFIVSPNITVNRVETVDEGFANSDHNPLQLSVTLN